MALRKFRIKIDGKQFEAEVEEIGGSAPTVSSAAPVKPLGCVPSPVVVLAPVMP